MRVAPIIDKFRQNRLRWLGNFSRKGETEAVRKVHRSKQIGYPRFHFWLGIRSRPVRTIVSYSITYTY